MNAPENLSNPMTLDEAIKIVSLLENPPEAEQMRRALQFYSVPDYLLDGPWRWGTNEHLRKVFFHYSNPQNVRELEWMLQFVKGKRSLLEVGSSFGGTLKRMSAVMPKGSRIVSVDLACDDTPDFLNPTDSLKETCRQIGAIGGNVELFIGDSHSPEVIEAVSDYAPYDFIFIDGDHSYDGIKADWENYGPMGNIVAFHDIGGPLPWPKRFWQELKASGEYRTEELVDRQSEHYFGIGVVFREA